MSIIDVCLIFLSFFAGWYIGFLTGGYVERGNR